MNLLHQIALIIVRNKIREKVYEIYDKRLLIAYKRKRSRKSNSNLYECD